MEAPEKIYVTECMLFATNPEITLQGNGNKIEYTRTDVIIKRACEWLKKNRKNYSSNSLGEEYFIKDFINYMKGK